MSDEKKKRLSAVAVAHYATRLRGDKSKIEVPEWGVTIYWNAWTLEEKSRCFRPGGFDPLVLADVLIIKAVDADGKPMVGEAERMEILGEWDPTIVERVARAIMDEAAALTSEAGHGAAKGN